MRDAVVIPWRARLSAVLTYGVAMGYFEAVLVVYLRGMFYPEGFSFPLRLMPARLIVIEVAREAATVVMLAAVAYLAGRRFWERFGWFLVLFGVWDIFYYIFLKATIGWPATLVDWDVLFLIPLPWIGPVLAPSLVALLMIAVGILIALDIERGVEFKPSRLSWWCALAATALILWSFMCDFDATLRQQMPRPYLWRLLIAGLALYAAGFAHAYRASAASHSAPDV